MTESNYWLSRRLGRRRVLATTGAGAAAALFLAACGGGSDSSSQKKDASSVLVKPADTSKEAKAGGVFKDSRNADVGNWDPMASGVWWGFINPVIFGRLTRLKGGYMEPASGEVVGDLAESWEFSPDRLTATFKLRPNATWHNIAPVNGRAFDSQDVVFSWNRFIKEGGNRVNYANSLNPQSPITSVTAPEKNVVVFKLAFPMVNLTALLAAHSGGNYTILAREADGGFEPKSKPIGTGPFFMAEHVPSSRFVVKKHPGYYDKSGGPYLDSVEFPIITEYAQGLAQLKAGGLYTYVVRGEDVLVTKKDEPKLSLYESAMQSNGLGAVFGYRPNDKSPFRDERLRQAFSMTWDRDQYIDVMFNVKGFTDNGIPVRTSWSTSVQNNYFAAWYLNPQGKDFGPNAKYFKRDVAEAKKLVAAAGFPSGVEVISNVISGADYGVDYGKQVDILEGYANEAGFKFTRNVMNYQTEFIGRIRDAKGNFDGMAWKLLSPSTPPDGIEAMVAYYSKAGGATFQGFDPAGKGTFDGDPYIEDLIVKARGEVDQKKAYGYVHDIQRYAAGKGYMWRSPGGATGVDIAWPAVRNFNVYQSEFRAHFSEWLDPGLPPMKA